MSRIEDRVFARLESEIARVIGVRGARITSENGGATAIHIVADRSRPAKQLVRDVQSLASAGFGLSIDHRIVSVVQLEEDKGTRFDAPGRVGRAALQRVIVGREGDGLWVRVGLSWPDGSSTEGSAVGGGTADGRGRAAAAAVREAVVPVLVPRGAGFDIANVVVQRLGTIEVVLAHAIYVEKGTEAQLVGCSVVEDDVASAAVQATLQAINRKLA